MDFTYLWMLMYGLTLILVVNLTNLISHAFSRENMVQDPVTHRTHYEVPEFTAIIGGRCHWILSLLRY